MDKLMDLHNHTRWSDGWHTPETIIENAVKNGITTIGITDHFHTVKCNSVSIADLELYMESINVLKDKYKDSIEVLCGIEICMEKEWSDLSKLPYDKLNKLDYVLLEYVEQFNTSVTFKELHHYTDKLTTRKGLAHTNLLILSEYIPLDEIIKHMRENNLFWEININEGYEYFDELLLRWEEPVIRQLFEKLRENNIEITVGSDTHFLDYYEVERVRKGNAMASRQI